MDKARGGEYTGTQHDEKMTTTTKLASVPPLEVGEMTSPAQPLLSALSSIPAHKRVTVYIFRFILEI